MFILFLCCWGTFPYILSQKRTPLSNSLLKAYYKTGDSCYRQALALSMLDHYDEKKEESLNKLALANFKKITEQTPGQSVPGDSILFYAAYKSGEIEHYNNHLDKAQFNYNYALSLKKNLPLLPDSVLFKPYLFSGIIYYGKNKYDSALLLFKRAEYIQEKYRIRLEESERLCNNLGVLYYEQGNYKQAKNYFQKAADVLPRSNPYYKDLYVNYKINLASVLFKLEDYNKADALYRQLLSYHVFLQK